MKNTEENSAIKSFGKMGGEVLFSIFLSQSFSFVGVIKDFWNPENLLLIVDRATVDRIRRPLQILCPLQFKSAAYSEQIALLFILFRIKAWQKITLS